MIFDLFSDLFRKKDPSISVEKPEPLIQKDSKLKITLKTLLAAITKSPRLDELVNGCYLFFPRYEIQSDNRIAAFLAQAAHETGGFKWFVELGGPSYFQKYEPYTSIGQRLGNSQSGDGYRFRGRGIFQLTGRWNYLKYSQLIDLNLIEAPDRAAETIVACNVACEYWKQNKLNSLADIGDMRAITKRINGGYNGLSDRLHYYDLLLSCFKALSV